jgi:hypothetical protein
VSGVLDLVIDQEEVDLENVAGRRASGLEAPELKVEDILNILETPEDERSERVRTGWEIQSQHPLLIAWFIVAYDFTLLET